MQQIMPNNRISDRKVPVPVPVSNRPVEPIALFAVPLPSSNKSDFLCLCKRLFWSVGSSYFSAFCPLTSEETRLLPHSSAVVQLVSVTPAIPAGNDDMPYQKQDLLAYTLSGDIVGIPYVAISKNQQPKGNLTKAFPFDDLATSAWVPSVNAPFVGCTTNGILTGPKRDVFIIKNDEKTRQSLLKGDNVIFSQQNSQTSSSEESNIKSAPIPQPEQGILQNLPQKESARPTGVSPTSSSLYKLYNSSKRDTDNGTPATPKASGLKIPVKKSKPAASWKCTKQQSAMVLPRIDAVFSLADSTTTNESLSKKIADTLAKRSALLQQNHAVKTSTPIDSGMTSKDTSHQHGNDSILRTRLLISPGTSTIEATTPSKLENSRSGATHTLATPTLPNTNNSGSLRKSPGLTVKQILMSRRQFTSPLHFEHSTPIPAETRASSCPEAVNVNEVADASVAQTCSDIPKNSDESDKITVDDTIEVALDGENSCKEIFPCQTNEQVKVPSLKMVIKTKRDNDNKVKTTCHPVEEELVNFARKVPRLKLHKLDISLYSFANPDLIVTIECESKKNATLLGAQETTSVGNKTNFQSENKHDIQPEATFCVHALSQLKTTSNVEDKADTFVSGIPENAERLASVTNGSDKDGKHKQKRKRRRMYGLTQGKRYKPSHNYDRPTEGREHLSDCQNTLPKRSKQHVVGDVSCNDAGAFSDYFPEEPTNHEPSKTPEVVDNFQNRIDRPRKEFETNVSNTAQKMNEIHDDLWSDEANSTDTEWEYPGKSCADKVDSDWDSSLEDEGTKSPFKCVQPIKTSPFGDFQHMVLKDRLRLLEQTLQEHQTVLNAIKRPRDTESPIFE